jgi:hypothetical protein
MAAVALAGSGFDDGFNHFPARDTAIPTSRVVHLACLQPRGRAPHSSRAERRGFSDPGGAWAKDGRAATNTGQPADPRWHAIPRRAARADDKKPPILRAYLERWKWEVGAFFDGVGPEAAEDELRRIAPDHPIFRISMTTSIGPLDMPVATQAPPTQPPITPDNAWLALLARR